MSKETLVVSIGVGVFVILAIGIMFGIIPLETNPIQQPVNEVKSSTTQTKTEEKKMKIEDITMGQGKEAKSGDTVVVNYKGTLENGKQFDSSYDRGQSFETQIGVGKVIKGWDEGIPGMKVGGKRKLTIPPELAYGREGQGEIPPNSVLIFEVELLDVK